MLGVFEEVLGNRPCSHPLACHAMRAGRGKGATSALVRVLYRGQPQGGFRELGRARRRATSLGDRRRVIQHRRGCSVGAVRRKRKMPGTHHAVVRDCRNSFVYLSAPRAEIVVEHRRQQRMRKPDRPALALDHVRVDSRLERVGRDPRPLEQRDRRGTERGCDSERVARAVGKSGEPCAQKLVEGLGDREWIERADVRLERAAQLQREERIPARSFVDAKQRLPGKRLAETIV